MAIESTTEIPLLDGGSMRGCLVLPEGDRPKAGWPGVTAIHDILGFSPDIRRIADRLASAGYATLAPALYDGAGAPVLCVARTLRDSIRGEGPAFARLEATRHFLASRDDVDEERIGVTGFCMGGGFALYWAAQGGLRVCAPFYGNVPSEAARLRKVCPVVAGYGALDRPFAKGGRELQTHLTELGIPHDVKIYEGVGHAFMNDHGEGALARLGRHTPLRTAYDEAAAEDSWRRMLAFFRQHP